MFLKCLSALCMSGGRPEKKIQCMYALRNAMRLCVRACNDIGELVEKVIIPGHKDVSILVVTVYICMYEHNSSSCTCAFS